MGTPRASTIERAQTVVLPALLAGVVEFCLVCRVCGLCCCSSFWSVCFIFAFPYVVHVFWGKRPKKGAPGPFGAKKRYILESSKKRAPRALPLVDNALCLFLQDKATAHPSLSTLLDF